MEIGPYTLEWVETPYHDPIEGQEEIARSLWIQKKDGEGMEVRGQTLEKLIGMLDEFWKQEF